MESGPHIVHKTPDAERGSGGPKPFDEKYPGIGNFSLSESDPDEEGSDPGVEFAPIDVSGINPEHLEARGLEFAADNSIEDIGVPMYREPSPEPEEVVPAEPREDIFMEDTLPPETDPEELAEVDVQNESEPEEQAEEVFDAEPEEVSIPEAEEAHQLEADNEEVVAGEEERPVWASSLSSETEGDNQDEMDLNEPVELDPVASPVEIEGEHGRSVYHQGEPIVTGYAAWEKEQKPPHELQTEGELIQAGADAWESKVAEDVKEASTEVLTESNDSGPVSTEMSFEDLAAHPEAGPVLQAVALEHLRTTEYFKREGFTGELDNEGYLLRADGSAANTTPAMHYSGSDLDRIRAEALNQLGLTNQAEDTTEEISEEDTHADVAHRVASRLGFTGVLPNQQPGESGGEISPVEVASDSNNPPLSKAEMEPVVRKLTPESVAPPVTELESKPETSGVLSTVDASALGFEKSKLSVEFFAEVLSLAKERVRSLTGTGISGINRMPADKALDAMSEAVENLTTMLERDTPDSTADLSKEIDVFNEAVSVIAEVTEPYVAEASVTADETEAPLQDAVEVLEGEPSEVKEVPEGIDETESAETPAPEEATVAPQNSVPKKVSIHSAEVQQDIDDTWSVINTLKVENDARRNSKELREEYLDLVGSLTSYANKLRGVESGRVKVLRERFTDLATRLTTAIDIGVRYDSSGEIKEVLYTPEQQKMFDKDFEELQKLYTEIETQAEAEPEGETVEGEAVEIIKGAEFRDTAFAELDAIDKDLVASREAIREKSDLERYEAVKRARLKRLIKEVRDVLGKDHIAEVGEYSQDQIDGFMEQLKEIKEKANEIVAAESEGVVENAFASNPEPELPFVESDFVEAEAAVERKQSIDTINETQTSDAEIMERAKELQETEMMELFKGGVNSDEWLNGSGFLRTRRALATQRYDDFKRIKKDLPNDKARRWIESLQERATGAPAPRPNMTLGEYVPKLYQAIAKAEQK